jgi:TolB-like protein/Flp pilus assembly protein TadD
MKSTVERERAYEFGSFRLDEAERTLLRRGVLVPLLPKSFDALLVLVKSGNRVMTKEFLLNHIWPDAAVEENSLAKAISDIRRALEDDARHPLFIVTVPRRGYRFVASVKLVENRSEPASQTVAVLPFTNLTPQDEQDYVGVGLADAVIARLSRLAQVIVRPTTAVLKYVGEHKDLLAAGRDLEVESVIDGTIRRSGDRIRVTVQLIGMRTGSTLWADRFDEHSTDIFAVEDSIAARVAAHLALQMTSDDVQSLARHDTENRQAHELYLKGRFFWSKRTVEGSEAAIDCFEQAIACDPAYAQAYAGLADAYIILGLQGVVMGGQPPTSSFPHARTAVERALAIDDTLAEAHAALGFIRFFYDFDWSGAEVSLTHALALNRRYAVAHHLYALSLMATERMEEALVEMERARRLEPVSLIINANLGWVLYHARRFDEALAQLRKTLEMDRQFVATHHRLGLVLEATGRYAEAIAAFDTAHRLSNGGPMAAAAIGYVHAVSGNTKAAEQVLEELLTSSHERYVAAPYIAEIYAGLGDIDRAIEWLEKGFEERSSALVRLRVNPRYDRLRADSRFQRLTERVGQA